MEEEEPQRAIWITENGADPALAQAGLRKGAERVLGKQKSGQMESGFNNKGAWLLDSIEPRGELLKLLVQDDSRGFIDCMVGHFEWMAQFTAVVDDILAAGKRGRGRPVRKED